MPESRNRDLATSLGQAVKNNTITSTGSLAVVGLTAYDSAGLLPSSYDSNNAGTLGFAEDSDKLYIHTGQGWFNIAIVNTTPYFTTSPDASYALATDATAYQNGTATVITLAATDSEGFPITWGYSANTAFNNMAYVSNDSSVYTIEPKSQDSAGSAIMPTGTLTFTASDGVNIVSASSSFTLTFDTRISNSEDTIMMMKATGNNLTNSPSLTAVTGQTVTYSSGGSSSAGGTIDQSSFSPYIPNASVAWTSDTASDNHDIQLGTAGGQLNLTNNFTVECWVWLGKSADNRVGILSTIGNNQMQLMIRNKGLDIWHSGGNGFYVSSPSVHNRVPVHKWTHIMWSRDTSKYRMFIDGRLVEEITSGTTFSNSGLSFVIGSANGDNSPIPFAIYDLRVLNGTCRKTADFAPPTEPLDRTGDGASTASHCVLQYASPNANPGQVETGYKPTGGTYYSMTREAIGSQQPTVSVHSPFRHRPYTPATYGGSAFFDGYSDSISVPLTGLNHTSNQAFTIEFWFSDLSNANMRFIDTRQHDTNNQGFDITKGTANNSIIFRYKGSSGSSSISISGEITSAHWHHIVVQYTGSNFQVYRDGKQIHNSAASYGTMTHAGSVMRFGSDNDGTSNEVLGHMADIRYVIGTAVYSGEFVPPKGALSTTGGDYADTSNVNTSISSGHTKLLLQFHNAKVYDNIGGHTMWMNYRGNSGDAKSSTGATKYASSSVVFDGADYSMVDVWGPEGSFNWMWEYACPFTIEGWIKTTTYNQDGGDVRVIFKTDNDDNTADNIQVRLDDSTGKLSVYSNGSAPAGINVLSTTVVADGNWHHFAVTRTGSIVGEEYVNVYIDGVHEVVNQNWTGGLDYKTMQHNSGVYRWTPRIGGKGTEQGMFNGHIEDLRVTKRARYPFIPVRENVTTSTSYQTGITVTPSNVSMLAFNTATVTDDGGSNANSGSLKLATSIESGRQPVTCPGPTGGMLGWRFDGAGSSGDRIHFENSDGGYITNNQDFSIDMWLKINSSGTSVADGEVAGILGHSSSSSTFSISYKRVSATKAQIFWTRGNSSSTNDMDKTSGVPSIYMNEWYHLAFAYDYSSTTGVIFVNGNYYDHGSTWGTSGDMSGSGGDFYIGQDNEYGNRFGAYDVSNLRIIKNQVIYTRNFTAPTAELSG